MIIATVSCHFSSTDCDRLRLTGLSCVPGKGELDRATGIPEGKLGIGTRLGARETGGTNCSTTSPEQGIQSAPAIVKTQSTSLTRLGSQPSKHAVRNSHRLTTIRTAIRTVRLGREFRSQELHDNVLPAVCVNATRDHERVSPELMVQRVFDSLASFASDQECGDLVQVASGNRVSCERFLIARGSRLCSTCRERQLRRGGQISVRDILMR